MTRWVYLFEESNKDMRNLLGGKGANLGEMTNAGLPVPPGFTITTEACNAYNAAGKQFSEEMWNQTLEAMSTIEKTMGKGFGDASNPLLVSVRSGARVSMPGMMDTILNLGLNDETLKGLAKQTNNERFAYDAYRRFIQLFAKIVSGLESEPFERVLEEYKAKTAGGRDTDLTTDMLEEIVGRFLKMYEDHAGHPFPTDPQEQLRLSIGAVFDSWMGKRAVDYRNYEKLPHDWGTAVNVMTMVFGNMGDDSGTGVAFTRNPSTGENTLYGEYLQNAQGEDVVAGIRTPRQITQLGVDMPEVYRQFVDVAGLLEKHYRDMQDLEFTVEKGKLWMLQTRTGKRTAASAVKIAVDMVSEGLITREEALMRVMPAQINQLLLPRFDDRAKAEAMSKGTFLARGLNASPGAGTGKVAFSANLAEEWGLAGEPVILVRPETSPDDVHGMLASKGILTQHGGATSHAAVVARGLGLPCVAGCEDISISVEDRKLVAHGREIEEGRFISIDGTTGEVFAGVISTVEPNFNEEFELKTLLEWADDVRRLGVWANADYPRDAQRARDFGAEGIGLCRTEHMFFEEDRLPIVQKMILAETNQERSKYLGQLLPVQRADFEGIFRAMDGYPVIIRLIDPPLHEFLPKYDELSEDLANLKVKLIHSNTIADVDEVIDEINEKESLLEAVAGMREMNPMLGLRGIRLGLMMPALIQMQVRAIVEAACNVAAEGVEVHPEIMIPLTGHVNELKEAHKLLVPVADTVMEEKGREIDYKFGTMIEVPRAAITADQIAEVAEFFSFGTNDLTQTTFGYSRDDAEEKFLLRYVEDKVLPANPFQTLDQDGVGFLVKAGVEKGRSTRPDLHVGICGEHGGDPASISFCHGVGLNYVSCSPFRVPVARLAAAQAVLQEETDA